MVKNIAKVVGLKVFEQVLLHPKSDDPNDDERVFGRVFHGKFIGPNRFETLVMSKNY